MARTTRSDRTRRRRRRARCSGAASAAVTGRSLTARTVDAGANEDGRDRVREREIERSIELGVVELPVDEGAQLERRAGRGARKTRRSCGTQSRPPLPRASRGASRSRGARGSRAARATAASSAPRSVRSARSPLATSADELGEERRARGRLASARPRLRPRARRRDRSAGARASVDARRGTRAPIARVALAVVTGAGGGIGRATALALARRGLDVALVGRTERTLRETAAEPSSAPGCARSSLESDVGIEAECAPRRADDPGALGHAAGRREQRGDRGPQGAHRGDERGRVGRRDDGEPARACSS